MLILVTNTDFNFNDLHKALTNYKLVFVFLILTFIQLYLASIRTIILMQFSEKNINIWSVIIANWAASFVANFSPVGLLGDAFRVSRLIKIDSSTKKDNSIYCAILSKIFSTLSLIILSFAMIFFSYDVPKKLQVTIWITFVFTIVFFFIARGKWLQRITIERYLLKVKSLFIKRRLDNLNSYLDQISTTPHKILNITIVSLLIQILNCLSFMIIIYSINDNVNFLQVFFLIPIGIFIMSLPISYGGLGVGNIAFSNLLSLYGITNGSEVFSVFFILSFLFNSIGFVPFIASLRSSKVY